MASQLEKEGMFMAADPNCIFCKIVEGKIPCIKVLEDEVALAFMDINPLSRGHILVVPKDHFETILDVEPSLYGHIASLICRLAKALSRALKPDGMNVMQLNGKAGNQVVPHVHMHIVPRWSGDDLSICAWEPVPGDLKDVGSVAELIKEKL
jgi:histidine triad (HIT) family protein